MKILVFGQPRTGTTLLAKGLDSHPDIVCIGEIFNQHDNVRAKVSLESGIQPWVFGEDQLSYLQELFSAPIASRKKNFAIKICVGQLPLISFEEIAKLFDLVIFTDRHPIAQFVSNKQAISSRIWNQLAIDKVNPISAPAINIPPEKISIILNKYDQCVKKYHAENSYIIKYQDLTKNYNSVMNAVFEKIGISSMKVSPQTKKIRDWDISKRIENWEEIKPLLKPLDVELV